MTEQQRQAFNSIAHSESGKVFIDYVESLIIRVTDIREMKEITEEEAKARMIASRLLQDELLDNLKERPVYESDDDNME